MFNIILAKNSTVFIDFEEYEHIISKLSEDGVIGIDFNFYPIKRTHGGVSLPESIRITASGKYFIEEGGYVGILEMEKLQKENAELQRKISQYQVEDRPLDKKTKEINYNNAWWTTPVLISQLFAFLLGVLVMIFFGPK